MAIISHMCIFLACRSFVRFLDERKAIPSTSKASQVSFSSSFNIHFVSIDLTPSP
jgi:hypothetical protein